MIDVRVWASRVLAILFFAATLAAPIHAILPDQAHASDCRDAEQNRHIDACPHESHAPHCDICIQTGSLTSAFEFLSTAFLIDLSVPAPTAADDSVATAIALHLPEGRGPPRS